MRTVFSLALVASAALLPAAALAAPITFQSNSASTSYYGYSSTQNDSKMSDYSTTSAPHSPGIANSANTYNLSNVTPTWHGAVGSSSWVSYDPQTGPTGSFTAPNGSYAYFTDVNLTSVSSDTYGLLTLMADDTVSVYLRNSITGFNSETLIVPAYNGTDYTHCAAGQPNCMQPLTTTFTGLATGDNYLIFVVDQANAAYTGLDYSGAVLTPEPGSLMLLSTGLLSGAGVVMRRFRRQR